MASFTGRVVLITGSSSGIGAEAAIEFARRGAHVVLVGRNSERLEQVVKKCKAESAGKKQIYFPVVADIEKEDDIKRIHKDVVAKFKKLDVLVNNAGSSTMNNIFNIDMAAFDTHYRQFVKAPTMLVHLFLPQLLASKGNIVNVSSACTYYPESATIAYSAMKAALDHLTRMMALDLAHHGVRANTVNPGPTMTSIASGMMGSSEQVKQALAIYGDQSPSGRMGKPQEIAKVIAFVASDDASFMNGDIVKVDGGFTLTSYLYSVLPKPGPAQATHI